MSNKQPGVSQTNPSFLGLMNMNGNRITNLGIPILNSDAATKEYVDSTSGQGSQYFDVNGRLKLANLTNPIPLNQVDNLVNNLFNLDTNKMNKNPPIFANTKTKVSYDSSGLILSGSDALTSDINDTVDKRYMLDSEKSKLLNIQDNAVAIDDLQSLTNKTYSSQKIDTLVTTLENASQLLADKNVSNGYPGLDNNGFIDINQIPNAALNYRIDVPDQAARFALTTNDVQNGDYVYQIDIQTLFYVKDQTQLNNSNGYSVTSLATTDWSNITNKPTFVQSAFIDTSTSTNITDSLNKRFVTDSDITNWNNKEDLISSGLSTQYWNGLKQWVNFPTIPSDYLSTTQTNLQTINSDVDFQTNKITTSYVPINNNDLTNKSYVDTKNITASGKIQNVGNDISLNNSPAYNIIGNPNNTPTSPIDITPDEQMVCLNQATSTPIIIRGEQRIAFTISAGTSLTENASYVLCDCTSGNFTVSLPSASNGNKLTIKKIDSTPNTATIERDGSDTINGGTAVVLSQQYQSVDLFSNGTTWFYPPSTGVQFIPQSSSSITSGTLNVVDGDYYKMFFVGGVGVTTVVLPVANSTQNSFRFYHVGTFVINFTLATPTDSLDGVVNGSIVSNTEFNYITATSNGVTGWNLNIDCLASTKMANNTILGNQSGAVSHCRVLTAANTQTILNTNSTVPPKFSGHQYNPTLLTTNTTLTTNQCKILTTGTITLTLPPATSNTCYEIIKTDANTTTLTIARSGTDLINGVATSILITERFVTARFFSNTTNWFCVRDTPNIPVINTLIFNGNGTYNPTTGMRYCIIELQGSGGGGGGNTILSNQSVICSGGNSGAYIKVFMTSTEVNGSNSIGIGIGGGSNVTGQNSTFGSLIVAPGGVSGVSSGITNVARIVASTNGILPTSTTGTIIQAIPGRAGESGIFFPGQFSKSGNGASTFFGLGGQGGQGGNSSLVAGGNAQANSGAGGGSGLGNSTTGTTIGGSGGNGKCIITEYIY